MQLSADFQYLNVVIAVVVGMTIAKTIAGAGRMIQFRRHVTPYWLHLGVSLGPLVLYMRERRLEVLACVTA